MKKKDRKFSVIDVINATSTTLLVKCVVSEKRLWGLLENKEYFSEYIMRYRNDPGAITITSTFDAHTGERLHFLEEDIFVNAVQGWYSRQSIQEREGI